jgi:tetratricopeptide (TPR) repeat protein
MESTIEQALQQGVTAHKEGKLQEAERLYNSILQAQPLHPYANHNLGVIAVSVNKVELALPLFKMALESNPKIEQFWLSYIDALIKESQFEIAKVVLEQGRKVGLVGEKIDSLEGQLDASVVDIENIESSSDELSPAIKFREAGKFQEAQEWLQKFIESAPNHAEAFSLLCHVLLLYEKDVEAERALLTAASINPKLASIHRNQARLLLKKSKPIGALKEAQIGYDCSGNDPESWLVLATCLNANQRSQEALDLTEKILLSNPNHAEALATKALIRLRSNDIIGAIADAGMSVLIKPHLTQVWVLLGSMHYKNKNLTGAIKAMEKAHELEPTNDNYMVALGEFFRQDNRASEAITILEKAAEMAPKNISIWINLGTAFQQDELIDKAKMAYEKALTINPKSVEVSNNLGSIAINSGDWMSALQHFENALKINPNIAETHYNLGITLKELGRLDEAEASYTQAIAMKPDLAEAYNNLGVILQELNRFDDAEASYTQAIALKADYAQAHSNLGNTLKILGRLDEAESSCRQAIELKFDIAEAHSNLGATLKELGRLKEAEASYGQAIVLKSNYAEAHLGLGIIHYFNGDTYSALDSIKKSTGLDPKSKISKLLYKVIQKRQSHEKTEICAGNKNSLVYGLGLTTNPFISKLVVEPELIVKLSEIRSRAMDEAINTPVYGNGTCSLNYNFFEDAPPIIKTVESNLISIIKRAVQSEVFVFDSFFNIYGAGAGIPPHTHLNRIDKEKGLNLAKQKYSLVYYISVGDQDCDDPGILNLYDPSEDILPYEGMVVVFPANRRHSAVYGGKTDRVIIGVNFYSL